MEFAPVIIALLAATIPASRIASRIVDLLGV